jgi:ABC-type transporter Mla subunit MlaD
MTTLAQQATAPHSPALLAGIAAQLAMLAEESEQLGTALCSDAVVASSYLVQLQQIDRLAQSLREMASVLAARDPAVAVAGIRLGELRMALDQIDAR